MGLHIPQKEKDNKMLGQIRKHLSRWAGIQLSLAGRIMVANQVILSSVWYLASCTDFSGQALKLARATVRNYIWSGKYESRARARVKWATVVLPIVRGGIKVLDPQWQAAALLVKLLMRGMSVGYKPWKALVRHRVAQTKQSRNRAWPAHENWIMNSHKLVKHGSSMWQGVLKAWSTIQSGLEQQDPSSWSEIVRQPLYGNRFLTNEVGVKWGTDPKTNMRWWSEREFRSLKDIMRPDGQGWKTFPELIRLRRTKVTPNLYARLVNSIPWEATKPPENTTGQWLASKEEGGNIQYVYHLKNPGSGEATLYKKEHTEQLTLLGHNQRTPNDSQEVCIIQTRGPRRAIAEYNPVDETEEGEELWIWGNEWICNLEWDPKEWSWIRLGIHPDTSILNYTTKRGYRVALRQDNQQMPIDAELEAAGYDSKTRAKFFNRVWHPYLPRKVSAMQWMILAEGLPVGAWRERLGLPSACQLCPIEVRETLQHAFMDCPMVTKAWDLFRATRRLTGSTPAYNTWTEVSRGLMTEAPGPSFEDELRWDTASKFSLNAETPWDILRAQLLWATWCQRVVHAFRDEQFHLGVVLWHAWRNTIYSAMEAYKELFRHKRNEEKRQEAITCFQTIWTTANIFGRLGQAGIKWNLTPHQEFLPRNLGAWLVPPIRINRLSQSPDPEAEFTARTDFPDLVQNFLCDIGTNWQATEQQPDETQEQGGPEAVDETNRAQPRVDTQPTNTTREAEEIQASEATTSRSRQLDEANENETDILTPAANSPTTLLPQHQQVGKENTKGRGNRTSQLDPPCGTLQGRLPLVENNQRAAAQNQTHHNKRTFVRAPLGRRVKQKCRFGPNSKGKRTIDPLQVNSTYISSNSREEGIEAEEELDELLREIDKERRQFLLIAQDTYPSTQLLETHGGDPQHDKQGPKSRPKARCRFGPLKRSTTTNTSVHSNDASNTPNTGTA